jgi:hypothetical protein
VPTWLRRDKLLELVRSLLCRWARQQPDLKGEARVRRFADAYLLAYSEEHVFYEFEMFLWSAKVCGSGTYLAAGNDTDVANLKHALIESFVVHLRNVIEFFYPGPGKPWPTDVVAADFCDSGVWKPPTSAILEDARKRANTEMAHLTALRIAGAPPGKEWDFAGLQAALRPAMRCFAKKALAPRLSPKVAEVIRRLET